MDIDMCAASSLVYISMVWSSIYSADDLLSGSVYSSIPELLLTTTCTAAQCHVISY